MALAEHVPPPARGRRRLAHARRSTPTTSTRSRSTPPGGARAIAQQLLDDAQREAAPSAACERLALDTGLHNRPARALYEAYGFGEREIRRAPDDRIARALGGPGFVGYLKAV